MGATRGMKDAPILDQIYELAIFGYTEDEDIETKILEDLLEALEVELYERNATTSKMADAFDNNFDGTRD
jgi:hypothetical protein